MSKKVAFPFLVLPDSAISSLSVLLGDRDEPLHEASDILEDWDYARDLDVRVEIDLDFESAADFLKIPIEEIQLLAILKIGTGNGNSPRSIHVHDRVILNNDTKSAILDAKLESAQLSGRISIECSLLLANSPGGSEAHSPRVIGSRLWTRRHDVLIEDGGASRFPIETIDFKKSFPGRPHEYALWYFDWRPGRWDMDFASNTRLYINSEVPEFIQRVADGDRLTVMAMLSDVMNQMITEVVLDTERDESLAECPDGSIGQQVMIWVEMAFPGMSWETIAAVRENKPGEYNAAILSAAELR